MSFDGQLLKRGFWLYVWRITGPECEHLYVGRTGDSSSANASSPFRRIGQHLDLRTTARGNAMARRLREAKLDCSACRFEMIAIGPIYEEVADFEEHKPLRDKTAALERDVVKWLRDRNYSVLGTHPRKGDADPGAFDQIVGYLESLFPNQPR